MAKLSNMADWAAEGPIGSVEALRRIRRDLHSHPELGFLEYRTAAKVATALADLGWTVQAGPEVMSAKAMVGVPSADAIKAAQDTARLEGASSEWIARMPGGQTGVVAQLRRGGGPTIAFRFDMDALPVNEAEEERHAPNRSGFASRKPGLMHACGHDGHTAIGVTVAAHLTANLDWRGTVKLIFQPAEEGGRGALSMVEAGVLDDVDAFFAAHLGCQLPTGKIASQMNGFLFSTKVDARFKGKAAHAAASPHEGANALLAASSATLALHGIAPHVDGETRLNVGRIMGGAGRNIIADACDIELELRGSSRQVLGYLLDRMTATLRGAAAMYGAEVTTDIVGQTIGGESTAEGARLVAEAARGVDALDEILPEWSVIGSEDATFMMERVRDRGGEAAYFAIGSDLTAPHHATYFDFDERSLSYGVDIFYRIANRFLNGPADLQRRFA